MFLLCDLFIYDSSMTSKVTAAMNIHPKSQLPFAPCGLLLRLNATSAEILQEKDLETSPA